jgi:glycosyltransferase involved in cell wall biosynthesis
MKIGMVTTQFAEVGGVENVVRNLSEQMREEHEVHLITRERPQNTEKFPEFDKVHIIEGTTSFKDYLLKGRKWFQKNSSNYDVLHFHNWSTIIPTKKLDCKTILTYHGTTLDVTIGNKKYHKAPIYWTLEQLALMKPDQVTSITESHLKPFIKSNYEIIRNGVNTEKYAPSNNKEKLREKHDVEGKGVLIVAQHEENKGHKNLVKVASKLDEEITLMIPSTGPKRKEIEQLAKEKNVNAKFYGKIPEKQLIELYQSADLFCLPSWNEGLPLSMLEALSTGLPILVSNVADNKQIIEESQAGTTVKPKDVEELTQKLENFLEEDLENKASNARKYAEQKLDWNKVANKYIKAYEEVEE